MYSIFILIQYVHTQVRVVLETERFLALVPECFLTRSGYKETTGRLPPRSSGWLERLSSSFHMDNSLSADNIGKLTHM